MSRTNLKIVRRFYELWNAREFDAMGVLLAPDAVAHMPAGWPEPGPFHGRDAIISQADRTGEDLGELTVVLEEITAHEDWVVTRHHTRGRGARSGLKAEFENSVAFLLRAEEIAEAHITWDHADALRAAGLKAE
jgi:ketosteroid isomerase-like protein